MYKIGVVGPRDQVLAFMAAGFTVYNAETGREALAALKKGKNENCAILYITAALAAEIEEEIARLSADTLPAIVTLPDTGSGYGTAQLKRAVERAVGADIIFKD
ncbi:MAG: V-type ATP synthase subunit F [Clostridiales bacterium]|nr:V-type ATP synthase subunit F [Clostridiales bacterium]